MSTETTYQLTYPRLFALAYRMTGSVSDAEDAVQEAWARLLTQREGSVEYPDRWLYRTVSHLAIDSLRASKRTDSGYIGPWLPEPIVPDTYFRGPEAEAIIREDVNLALLILLEHLSPDQRAVWVLRTTLELPFAEIAEIVDQTEVSTRQLFRRAKLRLESAPERSVQPASPQLAEAFLRTLQSGNAVALMSLLRDDAVWIGDGGGIRPATMRPVEGAEKVTRGLIGLTAKRDGWRVEPKMINGSPGILLYSEEGLDTAWAFLEANGRITHVLVIRNPKKLAGVTPRVASI